MAEEGRLRRKALGERLKAKRRAKDAEVERKGAEEGERLNQDADLTRLEELETEVCIATTTPSIQLSKTDSCHPCSGFIGDGRTRAAHNS